MKKPAEDLWMAILAAQGKLEEAKECFLDLSEQAFELVIAEQQRAREKTAQASNKLRAMLTEENPDAT